MTSATPPAANPEPAAAVRRGCGLGSVTTASFSTVPGLLMCPASPTASGCRPRLLCLVLLRSLPEGAVYGGVSVAGIGYAGRDARPRPWAWPLCAVALPVGGPTA